jgi:hypothetical protein
MISTEPRELSSPTRILLVTNSNQANETMSALFEDALRKVGRESQSDSRSLIDLVPRPYKSQKPA